MLGPLSGKAPEKKTKEKGVLKVVEGGLRLIFGLRLFQGGSGTEPEPGTGTVGTVFPETESRTGTVGTVFQEPKPEPSFPVIKLYWNTEQPFFQRNRQNRKPKPLEPFHPQTVTEPNRTGASLLF